MAEGETDVGTVECEVTAGFDAALLGATTVFDVICSSVVTIDSVGTLPFLNC